MPSTFPTFPISYQSTGTPIRGITWPLKRSPVFNTVIHRSPSGATLAVPLYSAPLWHFELTYSAIPNDLANRNPFGGPSGTDVQILTNFWIQQMGPAFPFFFEQPDVYPGSGALLLCRFSEDNGLTLEDFTHTLTALQSLKIEQTR